MAWAPPKTINEDAQLKEFWDVDAGAAYIPWGRLPADLEPLTAGGEAVLDETSLPLTTLSQVVQPPPQPAATDEPAAPTGEGQPAGKNSIQ